MFSKRNIKVSGITYQIGRLSPSSFISEDVFALNNIIEQVEAGNPALDNQDQVDQAKESIFKIINKSLIGVKKGFKTLDTEFALSVLMKNTEVYSYLFTEIIRLSFGIKKKTKYLFL